MIGRRLALVLACLAGTTLSACGNAAEVTGPEAPQPGTLTVRLTTPFPDDRAVLITVSGPDEVGAVAAAGAGYTIHTRVAGTTFRAAVFGRIASGPLITFSVPDVSRLSAYTATVQEVVDPESNVRPSGAGYSLVVSR